MEVTDRRESASSRSSFDNMFKDVVLPAVLAVAILLWIANEIEKIEALRTKCSEAPEDIVID